jgi:hypothetical protein
LKYFKESHNNFNNYNIIEKLNKIPSPSTHLKTVALFNSPKTAERTRVIRPFNKKKNKK